MHSVDASMGTAPVYIHAVIPAFAGEYSLCVHKMHSSHSFRRQGTETGDGSLSPSFFEEFYSIMTLQSGILQELDMDSASNP